MSFNFSINSDFASRSEAANNLMNSAQEPEKRLINEYLWLYFLRDLYPQASSNSCDAAPEVLQLLDAQRNRIAIASEELSQEANSKCYHTAREIFSTSLLQRDTITMAGHNVEQITRNRTSSNGHKRKSWND